MPAGLAPMPRRAGLGPFARPAAPLLASRQRWGTDLVTPQVKRQPTLMPALRAPVRADHLPRPAVVRVQRYQRHPHLPRVMRAHGTVGSAHVPEPKAGF
jgi:hypothetical protein